MITAQHQIGIVTLSIRDSVGATSEYALQGESGVFVGKSTNCGIQLRDRTLSDIHCRIGLENGQLWVQDWMSAEGTRLNGVVVDSRSDVQWGDVIEIGESRIAVRLSDANYEEHGHETAVVKEQCEELLAIEDNSDPFCLSFTFEEEETYDRETVALLRTEIEELQSSLAQSESQSSFEHTPVRSLAENPDMVSDHADAVLERMQELIDEANRSDERVAILEELLHAAEDANHAEREERKQLEAWVSDIEKRVGQREDEHAAEVESLRNRLEESQAMQGRIQRQLQDAAFGGSAPKQYELTLENLQNSNRELQEHVALSRKQCATLEQRLEEISGEQERALREERTKLSQEQAKLARMRFELSKKLSDVEEIPKATSSADIETSQRIQALRDHLREIHAQEKQEEKQTTLATRLTRLWKRIEAGQNG